VAEIRRQLPSVETVVAVPYLFPGETRLADSLSWDGFLAADDRAAPVPRPAAVRPSAACRVLVRNDRIAEADRPRAGGVLVDHLKTHAFHLDRRARRPDVLLLPPPAGSPGTG